MLMMVSVKRIGFQLIPVFQREVLDSVGIRPELCVRKQIFFYITTRKVISILFVISDEYPFQLHAEAFRLIFRSDNYTTGPGFKISYKLLNDCRHGLYWDPPISIIPGIFPTNIPCFTQVTERKGTINTPYFPKSYPENMDCVYEFIR